MRKIFPTITCLFASICAYADGPNYKVFPQLSSLAVNYHVESNKRETVVYATNHEKKSVLCDASLTTNKQETSKGHEVTIAPNETHSFAFRHRASITDVRIYLMCEASKNSGADESIVPDPVMKQEIPSEKPNPVIEEDLGNP